MSRYRALALALFCSCGGSDGDVILEAPVGKSDVAVAVTIGAGESATMSFQSVSAGAMAFAVMNTRSPMPLTMTVYTGIHCDQRQSFAPTAFSQGVEPRLDYDPMDGENYCFSITNDGESSATFDLDIRPRDSGDAEECAFGESLSELFSNERFVISDFATLEDAGAAGVSDLEGQVVRGFAELLLEVDSLESARARTDGGVISASGLRELSADRPIVVYRFTIGGAAWAAAFSFDDERIAFMAAGDEIYRCRSSN